MVHQISTAKHQLHKLSMSAENLVSKHSVTIRQHSAHTSTSKKTSYSCTGVYLRSVGAGGKYTEGLRYCNGLFFPATRLETILEKIQYLAMAYCRDFEEAVAGLDVAEMFAGVRKAFRLYGADSLEGFMDPVLRMLGGSRSRFVEHYFNQLWDATGMDFGRAEVVERIPDPRMPALYI